MPLNGLLAALKAQGVTGLACFQGWNDGDPKMANNARVSIVGVKPDPAKTSQFKIGDAMALYPLWGGGKIVEVVVSNDYTDIANSIGASTNCGPLTVAKN